MGTALNDLSVDDDGNLVGAADGGKPVRHHERGSTLAKLVERLLNEHFCGVVEGISFVASLTPTAPPVWNVLIVNCVPGSPID